MARELKTGAADENNFSPKSSFASGRMLLTYAIIYNLAVTALDVKAFFMVSQVETLFEDSIVSLLTSENVLARTTTCSTRMASAHSYGFSYERADPVAQLVWWRLMTC